jgi:protein-tyrosine-phosphatase
MNLLKPGKNEAVPDPYYRALEACEEVYSLLDAATDKILEDLLKEKKA